MTPAVGNQTIETSGLLVGRNSHGAWVVRDRAGRRGGLFLSLADAQRYIRLQSIGRASTSVTMTGALELELAAA